MVVEALSSTADIEEARQRLLESIAGLVDAELDVPNVIGHWAIRDILAHIITWDEWGEQALATLERGEAPIQPDETKMNRAAEERFRSAPRDDLERTLRTARRQLLGRVAALTDDERDEARHELGGRMLSVNDFVDGFMDHDLEHASHIRAWRKARGK